jgi:predicted metal-dependent hydrolase
MFNARRFFESHESLENFYLRAGEDDKPFLEGLVQMAAAFRLFCDLGEVRGPARMIRQAIIRLENYQPYHLGIRVNELIRAMDEWTKRAEADGEPSAALHDLIPKVRSRWFSDK